MNSVSPFPAAFIDQATVCIEKAPKMLVHSEYSVLIRFVMNRKTLNVLRAEETICIRDDVTDSRSLIVETFHDYSNNGLHILKFHVLRQLADDIEMFGSIGKLYASPFEEHNVHVERAYHHTSQQLCSGMDHMRVCGESERERYCHR